MTTLSKHLWFGVLALLMLFITLCSASATIRMDDVIVAYQMENDADCYDTCTYDGTVTSGEWGEVSDYTNIGFLGTTSNYIQVPDNDDLSFTDGAGNDEPFGIRAVINFSSSDIDWIVSKGGWNYDPEYFFRVETDGSVTFLVHDAGDSYEGVGTDAGVITDGVPAEIVVNYRPENSNPATEVDIWVNGVNKTTTPKNDHTYTGMTNGDQPLSIGVHDYGTLDKYDGDEDELLIINRTFTEEEISFMYNSGSFRTLSEIISNGTIPDTPWNFSVGARNRMDNSSVDNATIYIGYNTTTANGLRDLDDCNNGLVSFWDGRDFNDRCGRNNGTQYGDTVLNSSGYFGNDFEFDGDGDYITANYYSDTSIKNYTITAWINNKGGIAASDYGGIVSIAQISLNPQIELSISKSYGTEYTCISDIGSFLNAKSNIKLNEWFFLACVLSVNSTQTSIYNYKNGELVSSDTELTNDFSFSSDLIKIGVTKPYFSRYFNGSIDEIRIYNRSLSPSEISELYRSSIHKYSGSVPIMTDINNESTIQTYNITLTKDNYFNQTFPDWNIASNITDANMTQAEVQFIVTELVTNNTFSEGNITIAGITKDLNNIWYLNASSYVVLFENNTHYDKSVQKTFVPYQNNTEYITGVYSSILNISSYFAVNNASVSDFEVTSINTNYSWENRTNATGDWALVELVKGLTYNITWAKNNYVNETVLLDITEPYQWHNFSVYTFNSVDFTFKDATNLTTLDWQTITLELISSVYANNYSTTNGSIYVDLLSPTSYAARYTGANYHEQFYYFNLVNFTANSITLYLDPNSTYSEVTVTVINEIGDPVENAYVKVLKYDINSNSYLLQEIVKTDFEGKNTVHIDLNNEFYKFIVEYPLDTQVKETSPSYITSTSITIPITIETPVATSFFSMYDIEYSLVYNNDTQNFRFSYTDNNAVVSQACLDIDTVSITGNTDYNSSCISSATGTILLHVAEVNGTTYEATAYVYINNKQYVLDKAQHTFYSADIAGKSGALIVVIMMMMFALMFYYSRVLALILTPIPLVLGSIIKLNGAPLIKIDSGITISILLISFIIAIIISKRSS